ncbi:MAG: hypothetical protein IT342_05685 [Candidatus Melainabacteria bacterium]|nr:hypothetical protein [Candidatus Melainabacteria bacterium]
MTSAHFDPKYGGTQRTLETIEKSIMKFIDQYTKLGARLWARPKRVAFLVDDSFENHDINNVVRYCLTHLGGRCNPIVPIEENRIGIGWENLLLALDPDLLYTFIPLSEELRKHLNQRLRPSRIVTAHSAHATMFKVICIRTFRIENRFQGCGRNFVHLLHSG